MDFKGFLVLISALLNILLGLVIHWRGSHNKARLAFEFTVVAIIGWCISMFVYRLAGPETVTFWAKTLYFFPTFIPAGFIIFGIYFSDYEVRKPVLSLILFLNLALALLCYVPGAIIESVSILPGREKLLYFGWAYYAFYLAYIPSLFTASYVILFSRYLRAPAFKKQQLLYIFLGLTGASTIGIGSNLILPTLGNFRFNWLGQVTTFVWVAFTTYAIVKHRLMDVRWVVARVMAYISLLVFFGAFYASSLFLISYYLVPQKLELRQIGLSVSFVLLIALSFQPMRKQLEKGTQKLFFQNRYEPEPFLKQIGQLMASFIDLQLLTKSVIDKILEDVKISRAILLLKSQNRLFVAENRGFSEITQEAIGQIESIAKHLKTLVVFDELSEGELKRTLRETNIVLLIPIKTKDEMVGVLALGEKASGEIYNPQDVEVLEIVASQMALAIKNAQAYEEIKEFSNTLKEEISKATRDLKKANIRLRELSKLKDEFVSIASHELRTPMTAIKSYLWLCLYKNKQKLDKTTKRNIEIAYSSTERLIRLVQDMLTVSRIEGKRLLLDPKWLDLFQLAATVKEDLEIKAQEKQIKLAIVKPVREIRVWADEEKIREVFQNLVGNALKFTPGNGRIIISFEPNTNYWETRITDTGPGISPEDQNKLFQKFSRLNNSFTKIAEVAGTGLGLNITKQLIGLHHGRIWVKSKVGEGSTFYFTLPNKKGVIKNDKP